MDLNNIKFSWLDKHPIDWEMKRVKHVFHLSKSKVESSEGHPILSLTMKGIKFRDVSTNEGQLPENFDGYTLLDKDDIVFNPMDLISGWVDKSNVQGLISPSYKVLRTQKKNINRDYFKYFFQTHYTEKIFFPFGEGVHYQYRWGLGSQTLLNFPILVPPHQDQNKIVQFLDEKTELVDKLISTKEKKLTLLKEQRTSLINQIVTKGLNPNVKMKDSGVEWIGDIPEGWMMSKFKFDTKTPVQYGLNISGDKYFDEGIRFIRITDLLESGGLIPEDGKYLDKKDVPSEFLLKKFDILFCRTGHTVGKSYLHLEDGNYTSGGYLVRFNFGNYFESKFIFYISKTSFYWDWIRLNSVISTIENVNGDKYQNFQYPKPSKSEQKDIVEFLDTKLVEIDDLIQLEQKKIDLLKEYRQSLISEVVTGKIKVTTDE